MPLKRWRPLPSPPRRETRLHREKGARDTRAKIAGCEELIESFQELCGRPPEPNGQPRSAVRSAEGEPSGVRHLTTLRGLILQYRHRYCTGKATESRVL